MIKEIPGFPRYYADTGGIVWSSRVQGSATKISSKLRRLKPSTHKDGYLQLTLCKNQKRYYRRVASLVLETFVGPCPEGMESCHENSIRIDNRLSNLRWDTPKGNQKDRVAYGTWPSGENNANAKLNDEEVKDIRCLLENTNMTQEEIGKIFGVGRGTVSNIKTKRDWRHI